MIRAKINKPKRKNPLRESKENGMPAVRCLTAGYNNLSGEYLSFIIGYKESEWLDKPQIL
jgi:hypothetical protein